MRTRYCATLLLLATVRCFGETVVPIDLEKGNPIARALANGTSIRLVIDSAGGTLLLRSEAMAATGAEKQKKRRSATDIYGKRTESQLFKIATLELGGRKFTAVEASEAGEYHSGAPGDGILGREFLSRFVVLYDYPGRRITLFDPDERSLIDRNCVGKVVPLLDDVELLPVSTGGLEGRKAVFLWDSGASFSFIKRSFAQRNSLSVLEEPVLRQLTLGGEAFPDVGFVVLKLRVPAHVDAYLGFSFFAVHRICINHGRKEVRVSSAGPNRP